MASVDEHGRPLQEERSMLTEDELQEQVENYAEYCREQDESLDALNQPTE